ncbi:MAG: hypothetical protein LBS33_04655 [Streptococcaceae bacterium]|jgi:cytoskeletal protein RodZ|nr:hypothetical protein [Streptococcaceae bacterium]
MAKNKKEPWEQSIYDTREQEVLTRRGSKQRNRGSKIYMILLVISLFILCSVPIGYYVYQKVNEEPADATEKFAKSTSKSQSSSEVKSSEASTESATDSATPTQETPASSEEIESSDVATDENTTEVIAGEGVNQISERTGVPVETLLELNGFASVDQWFASPGQRIRIK